MLEWLLLTNVITSLRITQLALGRMIAPVPVKVALDYISITIMWIHKPLQYNINNDGCTNSINGNDNDIFNAQITRIKYIPIKHPMPQLHCRVSKILYRKKMVAIYKWVTVWIWF